MGNNTFEQEFQRRWDDIKNRGTEVGMTVSDICAAAGVSRATPERWKRATPLTVRLIDQLDQAVRSRENTQDNQA